MKALFKCHPCAVTGFVLAAAVTLFFVVRLSVSAVYWMDPAHHNATVKSWMTVGYIGKSWGLDPHEIDTRAGLPPPQGTGPRTLEQVARERGVPVGDLIAELNALLAVMAAEKSGRAGGDNGHGGGGQ